jgi:ATP-dependent DNA helicase RecQ
VHSHSAASSSAGSGTEERAEALPEPWLVWDESKEAALREEFARLAQRELGSEELQLARTLVQAGDVWAQGFEPEAIPTLSLALTSLTNRPLVILSSEAELLRARQIRFGARSNCWLVDHEASAASRAAAKNVLAAFAGGARTEGGVVWCTLEALREPEVQNALSACRPLALLVEGAHAVSPRAHELRPSLSLVPRVRQACGGASLVAFTRAASAEVREDAAARLGLGTSSRAVRFVHAPLLSPRVRLSVSGSDVTPRDKQKADLTALVQRLPRPTAVFCATPQEADEVFSLLSAEQVPVHRYHGAMPTSDRATEMLHFTLPGRRAVMVAVSAFQPGSGLAGVDAGPAATPEGLGLGFGRQKLRSLVHFCAPASLEQYAQELALLCDGEESSEAVLFLSPQSLHQSAATVGKVRVTRVEVESVAQALGSARGPLALQALERQSGVGRKATLRVVRIFADAGLVRLEGTPNTSVAENPSAEHESKVIQLNVTPADLAQAAALLDADLEEVRARDTERLDALVAYAGGQLCRQRFLHGRFGEAGAAGTGSEAQDCGLCDKCRPERVASRKSADSTALVMRRRAMAQAWGNESAESRSSDEDVGLERQAPRRSAALGVARD